MHRKNNVVQPAPYKSADEKAARSAAEQDLIEFVRAMAREHARRDYKKLESRMQQKGGRPKKRSLITNK